MTQHNPENERIKRKYFAYLKEATRHSEPTVDAVAKALSRFEEYTRYRDFKTFHYEQAVAFKRHLAEQKGQRSGERLSKATLHATLTQLKQFFQWLAWQPGYKARLRHSDAEYFNLSGKDTRIATAQREQKAPTLEQIKHVIHTMASDTEIERRNRALIAFTLLTGARDSAIASMKLKHVDLTTSCAHQDARDVKTKFGKTFTTYFFPVGEHVRIIVAEWIGYLRQELLWGNDDPIFPSTRVELGANRQFAAVGLDRTHWSGASPIRAIFREAFQSVGLPYFNPHSFRNALVRLGQEVCKTPEDFKAWSQNLGHEKVLTTFLSYGEVACRRQGEILRSLATPQKSAHSGADAIAEAVLERLRDAGVNLRENNLVCIDPAEPMTECEKRSEIKAFDLDGSQRGT
jgi:site-specific recombinase XerD